MLIFTQKYYPIRKCYVWSVKPFWTAFQSLNLEFREEQRNQYSHGNDRNDCDKQTQILKYLTLLNTVKSDLVLILIPQLTPMRTFVPKKKKDRTNKIFPQTSTRFIHLPVFYQDPLLPPRLIFFRHWICTLGYLCWYRTLSFFIDEWILKSLDCMVNLDPEKNPVEH